MAERRPRRLAPLVPANCDLRSFPRMSMDVQRLFGSEFHALTVHEPDAWGAAVRLWLRSWHEVPAGSLPSSDALLQRLAELRPGVSWPDLKSTILRGWVTASDGRLYHPVVSQIALEAWIDRLASREKGERGNAKRYGYDADTTTIAGELIAAATCLRSIAPESAWLRKAHVAKALAALAQGSPEDRNSSRTRIAGGSQRSGAERSGDLSSYQG